LGGCIGKSAGQTFFFAKASCTQAAHTHAWLRYLNLMEKAPPGLSADAHKRNQTGHVQVSVQPGID
jgi:hypothetical protein